MSGFHDHDLFHVPDGRKTMGNDKCGLAFGKLLKSLLDLPFGDVIQGRGCFIPENDVWFAQERAGNTDPLALTTG